MPDTDQQLAIDYQRHPRRRTDGLFAGWYITFGALNFLIGLALLAGNAFTFAMIVLDCIRVQVTLGWVPFDALIPIAFSIVCNALIIVGSVGSFWRRPFSRQLLLAGLAGELLYSVVFFAIAGMAYLQPRTQVGLALTIVTLRMVYAGFFTWAYLNTRASFYFGDHASHTDARLPITIDGEDASGIPGGLKPPAANFRVRGVEIATGKEIQFSSKAPTEALAKKTAVAMGLDPTTLTIERRTRDGLAGP